MGESETGRTRSNRAWWRAGAVTLLLLVFVALWSPLYYGNRTLFVSNIPLALVFFSAIGSALYYLYQRSSQGTCAAIALALLVPYNLIDIVANLPLSAQLATGGVAVYLETLGERRTGFIVTASLVLLHILYSKLFVHHADPSAIAGGLLAAVVIAILAHVVGSRLTSRS